MSGGEVHAEVEVLLFQLLDAFRLGTDLPHWSSDRFGLEAFDSALEHGGS